ncbi:DUF4377 domain-containing protein [Archangium violaceum]|uniref:DUF4377 domain-containing protein n=1 Tax=Archangium violaceum TaxID=83451 RepID=UPI00194E9127|nr:DUF4377 domain-containing protein [Archangium violaceum]QRN93036.1 DUF4377 domain-containing protein [Archangium violaceum]
MVPCHGLGPWLCIDAKEVGSGERQLFYEGISGFSFQWGVAQTIDVRVHDVANPPADGASKRYSLERTVKRNRLPEGSRFQLALTGDFIWPDRGSGISLLSTKFVCATQELCGELARLAGDSTRRFTLEFSYPSSYDKPLVAERLISTP